MWNLLTISPQDFKGGTIWAVIQTVHGTLQATGLALLVLFFAARCSENLRHVLQSSSARSRPLKLRRFSLQMR